MVLIVEIIHWAYPAIEPEIQYQMKWLEIVELRSAGSDMDVVEFQLKQLLAEAEKEMQGKGIKSYRRVTIDMDFSIHLFHSTTRVETCGSALGLRLVSALKEFGLVNHSIWNEMEGK